MRGNAPLIGNYLVSPEYQQYDQAARDFINATLRRESGAAISQSEFNNAYRQYLPRPGDSREVLAQKQRDRMTAIQGISAGAGAGFIPPFSFDRQGNIVDYQGQQPQPSGGGGVGGVGAVAPGQPVRVGSPEEAMRLPPGTQFLTPDGRIKVRP